MENKLTIYNTMSRRKEEFKPLNPPFVGLYVCGPTVYGDAHLGYKVRYIRNITDVGHLTNDSDDGEDKIEKKAKLDQLEPMEIVQFYTNRYHKNMEQLNTLPPSIEPHASGHILEQQALVKKILENGYAYESDGSIYFDVEAYNKKYQYGKLSGRKIEELFANTRQLDGQSEKRNPYDFALWKKASPEHIMRWPSPWSDGFPGWHLECSVMSKKYIGDIIDIHAGGEDLIFPHHENEIAQSEAANDKEFARYWMHNGFLKINNEKMSKSLGNFFTVREIADKYPLQVIRFFMLSAHYRSPLNFSADLVEASKNGLERILTDVDKLKSLAPADVEGSDVSVEAELDGYTKRFETAMDDDLNTADAISVIFELVKYTNINISNDTPKKTVDLAIRTIEKLCDILGIITEREEELLDSDIEALINERQEARKAKNFARADEIRNMLSDKGIILEDTREGVKWKRA